MQFFVKMVSSCTGNDKSSLQKQLCDSIEPTPVGGVLRAVNQEDCEDFYKKYLNDFVRIVHRCNHNYVSQEYEVITLALTIIPSLFPLSLLPSLLPSFPHFLSFLLNLSY